MSKKAISIVLIAVLILSTFSGFNWVVSAVDSRVESAITWAVQIANDNSHGYSQANRNGPDYDCSSLVSTAFHNAGFSVSDSEDTATMLSAFQNAGFIAYNKGNVSLQRGDIMLRPKTATRGGHTELYLGNNQCVAAHGDFDGVTGDSSGYEIQVRSKSDCDFCLNEDYTYILRYNGGYNPRGYLDSISGNVGSVSLCGWVLDDDDLTQSIYIHVYIGGSLADIGSGNVDGYSFLANVSRKDVDAVHHCGEFHGFDVTIPTNKTGSQPVYIYGINIGGGESTELGHATVTIQAATTMSVSFNANDGECPMSSKTVTTNASYGSLPKPTRSGYTFTGWYTASSGGTQITENTTVTATSDHTLYAHWRANVVTIYYDCYGSDSSIDESKGFYFGDYNRICSTSQPHQTAWGTENVYYETLEYGQTLGAGGLHDYADFGLTPPIGYAFYGWRSGDNGELLDETTQYTATDLTDEILDGDCDVWLTARHTLGQYDLFFDANGGYCGVIQRSVLYSYPYDAFSPLPTATRDGYTFLGWFTAPEGGQQITDETIVTRTEDHTLYAHWQAITVTDISINTMPTKMTYTVGDTLDTTDLSLTVNKSDGTSETVTTGFDCTPTELTTAGTQTITVIYGGQTATFTVTVAEPEIPDEEKPRLFLSDATAKAGERIDVTLSIMNNPGIVATSVSLAYDNTVLKLVDVQDGGLLGSDAFSPGNDYTCVPYTVLWEDGLVSQNYTGNGVL